VKTRVIKLRNLAALAVILLITESCAMAQRQMEKLDRGVVAINKGNDSVFVSWRMLGTEPDDIAFNIYRQSGAGEPGRLNKVPIRESTCYQEGNVDFTKDCRNLNRFQKV
jgi:rhamnogalacturonan endolyase